MSTVFPFYTKEINTGKIFTLFYLKFLHGIEPFSDKRTYTRIYTFLNSVLNRRNIISQKWETLNEKTIEYFKADQDSTEPKTYFLRSTSQRGDGYSGNDIHSFDIVNYKEDCILNYDKDNERERFDYRFFFALNIAFTDVSFMNEFLDYQLNKNFQGDIQQYIEFLDDTLLAEIDLISEGKKEKARRYMERALSSKQEKWAVIESNTTNKESTVQAEIPAFHQVTDIYNVLQKYFQATQHKTLRTLLDIGMSSEKLVFKGQGNQLADAFKRLYTATLITGCNKAQLIEWIMANFKYVNGSAKSVSYTEKYLNNIISTEQSPCKSPIIEIKKDNDGKVIILSPDRKGRNQE